MNMNVLPKNQAEIEACLLALTKELSPENRIRIKKYLLGLIRGKELAKEYIPYPRTASNRDIRNYIAIKLKDFMQTTHFGWGSIHKDSPDFQIFQFFVQLLDDEKQKVGKSSVKIEHFVRQGLSLDIKKGLLQYDGNNPMEVSSGVREVKLLIILLQADNTVVSYSEIAEYLEINSYHPDIKNEDVSREIQFIKRDLIKKYLIPAGMTRSQANSLITTKTKVGYVLRSNFSSQKTR